MFKWLEDFFTNLLKEEYIYEIEAVFLDKADYVKGRLIYANTLTFVVSESKKAWFRTKLIRTRCCDNEYFAEKTQTEFLADRAKFVANKIRAENFEPASTRSVLTHEDIVDLLKRSKVDGV